MNLRNNDIEFHYVFQNNFVELTIFQQRVFLFETMYHHVSFSYHDNIVQELCGEHFQHLRELYVQNVPELA